MRSALPGFEREPKTQQEYGLLIPEYNVGIYRKSGTPQVGPSGLMLGYFFDVRIEADEEESLEEENLKLCIIVGTYEWHSVTGGTFEL